MKTEKLTNLILISILLVGALVVTTLADAKGIERVNSRVDPFRRSYLLFESDAIGSWAVQRTYSSRSIFRGRFGIGWCSSLDASVTLSSAGPQYLGCDLSSGDRVDSRTSRVRLKTTATGFERVTEDGQIQQFNSQGQFTLLRFKEKTLRIHRDSMAQINALTLSEFGRSQVLKVTLETQTQTRPEEALIRSLGSVWQYRYSEGLLTEVRQTSVKGAEHVSRRNYDEVLNLQAVTSKHGTETMVYNPETDELISVTRTTAFGRDRLLLGERSRGETMNEVEIQIEMKRGVEIHPARILYEPRTQRLLFEGSRRWAREIFEWLSA